MKISILGLGYVGAVSGACLAADGHEVIGVDVSQIKVDLINSGQSPAIENGLPELIQESVAAGRLRATTDVAEAVAGTDISLICVGTPSQLNGNLDLSYVRRVCEQIGAALKVKAAKHTVVARSTMLPGSIRNVVIPTLEAASGKIAGVGFDVCINPEFLREGTAIADFRGAPKTVIGELTPGAGDKLVELYAQIEAPLVRTDLDTAEMVKYTDNCWHAVKVAFANEIGNLSKAFGLDGHAVMDIFCKDVKLNLSANYLKPGFAFGGSCLPKDLRALNYKGRSFDLELPLLSSVLPSNELQLQKGASMIRATGCRKIGILGMAFKAGTDDLRESPMVTLIESLLGKGYEMRIYDRNVNLANMIGANRDYLLNHIPHISRLLVQSVADVVDFAEAIVIGNGSPEFRSVIGGRKSGQKLVDLVRILPQVGQIEDYDGICW